MKLTIMTGAYALVSDIKVDDIVLLQKSNPDALKIKDKDGNDQFAISYNEGKPSVAPFGVTFGAKNLTDGKATITKTLPAKFDSTEKAKEYVAEEFGAVVANLKQLESTVPEAAKKVRDEKKALIDGITVS